MDIFISKQLSGMHCVEHNNISISDKSFAIISSRANIAVKLRLISMGRRVGASHGKGMRMDRKGDYVTGGRRGNDQVNECCSNFPGWSVGKLINYFPEVKGLYK